MNRSRNSRAGSLRSFTSTPGPVILDVMPRSPVKGAVMKSNLIANSLLKGCLVFLLTGSVFGITSVRHSASGQTAEQGSQQRNSSNCLPAVVTVWEYKVPDIIYNSSGLESDLNKLGADGWELLHIEDGFPAIFRRPKHNDLNIAVANQKQNPQIEGLPEKRIRLLSQRVGEMKKLLDSALVDINVYTRSEIDLIQAKLDYSTPANEKLQHLRDLLQKYDLLIEVAELRLGEPPERKSATAKTDLLWLKSERVRIELQMLALDQ